MGRDVEAAPTSHPGRRRGAEGQWVPSAVCRGGCQRQRRTSRRSAGRPPSGVQTSNHRVDPRAPYRTNPALAGRHLRGQGSSQPAGCMPHCGASSRASAWRTAAPWRRSMGATSAEGRMILPRERYVRLASCAGAQDCNGTSNRKRSDGETSFPCARSTRGLRHHLLSLG